MPLAVRVYRQAHYGLATLAEVERAIFRMPGVRDAAVVVGTASNRQWLAWEGLSDPVAERATREDLIVSVYAESERLARQALDRAEALLEQQGSPDPVVWAPPRTLRTARQRLPQADLAVISIDGRQGVRLAEKALAGGLHVLLFSGGVSLQDELALKTEAARRGLLLLGPAAGAVVLGGVSYGFASRVPRGHVGLVGTDGGALQHVATLIVREQRQVGISQAIAVGARDLQAELEGRTAAAVVRALLEDEQTEVLVLLGARPDRAVARRLVALLQEGDKAAVVAFLGYDHQEPLPERIQVARTYQEAALLALGLERGDPLESVRQFLEQENRGLHSQAAALSRRLRPGQRYVRGLYSNRSLSAEAIYVLESMIGGRVRSNVTPPGGQPLSQIHRSRAHTVVDMGADEFATGRISPVLDPVQRNRRLLREAEDPEVAILLLDVLLGAGGHRDPVGEMAQAIQSARAIAGAGGRDLLVLASVCGTREDPQDLWVQEEKLRDGGAVVLTSNAAAAKLAGLVVRAGRLRE